MSMLLSRFLVLILLLTVLAPGFGWQAAGGMTMEMAAVDAPHAHHGDGHDMPCGDMDAHCADEACAEMQHHCCPGHILNHLAVQQTALMPVFAGNASSLLDRGDRDFASRVPAGLERPPRHLSA
jgi:uncharacterized protein involved in copper resistance